MRIFLHKQQYIDIFSTKRDIVHRYDDTAEEARQHITGICFKNYRAKINPDPDIIVASRNKETAVLIASTSISFVSPTQPLFSERYLLAPQDETIPQKAGHTLARHIQCDHAIFEQIIPTFSAAENRRMHQLVQETEALNTQLAIASAETVKTAFDLDYTEGNIAARTQLDMTLRFREIVQSGEAIRNVNDYMDQETAAIVQQFSQASRVHTAW